MKKLKTHSLLLLIISLVFQLQAYAQFVPDTLASYYFIQKTSNMVVGENTITHGAKIFKLNPSDQTQKLSFVPTGIENQYLVKNGEDRYLTLNGNWNMDFIADSIGLETMKITDGYSYEIITTSMVNYFQLSCINHPKAVLKVIGSDATTDSASVYSDKSGEDDKYMWSILKTDEFVLDDATLTSLTTDIGVFNIPFDPNTEDYEITVPYGTKEVVISAIANNLAATITYLNGADEDLSDEGIIPFTNDGVDVKILVTAYDGTKMSYYLAIYVDEGVSDATLKAIDLSVSSIAPLFDTDIKNYTTMVPYGTTTVEISATPNFPDASITGGGTITLTPDSTIVNLIVTSANTEETETYSITIYTADGQNYAMSLPGGTGASSHINITGVQVKDFPYTIEMWFKPEGVQTSRAGLLFARNSDTNDNAGMQYSESGGLYGISNISSYWYGVETASISPDAWHHVAFEITDSTRTIYLDGVETSATDDNTLIDYLDCNVYLGWDAASSARVFKGLIDEVRIWNTIRTDKQLKDNKYEVLMGNEEGLIAYYNFDTNSPSVALDLSSNAHNGIIVGGTYVESFPRANLELSSLSIGDNSLYPIFSSGVSDYHTVLPQGTSSLEVVAEASSPSTTITGTGTIAIGDTGTIVITATNGDYSIDYTIHYQQDVPFSLMHSYPFTDGTAKDIIGDADGTLHGETYIKEGICISDSLGGYISFPANEIAINTYTSITIELYIQDTEVENPDANTMFNYFGAHSDTYGVDGYFTNAKSLAAISCHNYSEPWNFESSVSGTDLKDDISTHHVISTLNNDSITLYIDGNYIGSTLLSADNKIYNLSNDVAYLFKSGYTNDNTWLGSIIEYNIYQGIMETEMIGNKAFDYPSDEASNDATLSDITIDDSTIIDFNSTYMEQTVTIPFGSTEVPELAATPKEEGATAVVTPATSISDTTTIVVTSSDGQYTNTYSISFVNALDPSSAMLSDLTVADTTIAGFDPATLKYSLTLINGETLPIIDAVATNDKAYIDITAATTASDTTFITVTSEDSTTTQVYTVTYKLAASVIRTVKSNITITPTISNGAFTINTDGGPTVITVYILSGKIVKQLTTSSKSTSFTLTESQMYIVKVDTESETQMFKIFKR